MNKKKVQRRSFLNGYLSATLGGWAAAVLYPIFSYLKPSEEVEAVVSVVKVDTLDNFPPKSGRIVPFGQKPVLVIRLSEEVNSFRAFLATCTHLDCTVSYRPESDAIVCPCHNGVYELNGLNLAGPPSRPLTEMIVSVRDGDILVSRGVV